jgi:hypothetical protein
VSRADPAVLADADLVVAGGPTRARGMSLAFIRKAADKPAARRPYWPT